MPELRIELYDRLVGHLVGSDRRTFDFRPNREAIEHFGLGSTILSESVPLALIQPRSRAQRRRNFFAELIPEGRALTRLATTLRTGESDVTGLLAAYGRDVAGAIQIYDPEEPGEPRTPATTLLGEAGIARLFTDLARMPLGNAPLTGKSSLAGVQDKIVVALIADQWHQVHDGYPSTHIIKPVAPDHPTTIFDEEIGSNIAWRLGLAHSASNIEDFAGVPGLVIQRYDRTPEGERLHQEDFNQVLGASGDQKYQEIGGKVSLRRVASALQAATTDDSFRRLLDLLVLTIAVGNLDLHAKNISLIHHLDGSATLAPAYDVVPMRHQPNDGRLAMSVNGVYVHAKVTAADLVKEAESWGLSGATTQVAKTLDAVTDTLGAVQADARANPGLLDDIAGFVAELRAGQPAGHPTSTR